MKFDIEIDDRTVLEELNRLVAAADDLSPAMRDIAGVLASAATITLPYKSITYSAKRQEYPHICPQTSLLAFSRG